MLGPSVSLKSSASSKGVNKVSTFLLTKNLELDDKQEELRLIQDKIKQISSPTLMKNATKTPSFGANISNNYCGLGTSMIMLLL